MHERACALLPAARQCFGTGNRFVAEQQPEEFAALLASFLND